MKRRSFLAYHPKTIVLLLLLERQSPIRAVGTLQVKTILCFHALLRAIDIPPDHSLMLSTQAVLLLPLLFFPNLSPSIDTMTTIFIIISVKRASYPE